ncbi:methylated-DNA--[protein]-cysteine S-methyltransferase [Kitasatospora albolonga]|uniref:methylated-DNA--[protein]-cysteine S-methyltransferase n=1 Tax=Kitasatospora albolonga TaxID=68173 RepID=UPI0035ECF0CB
MTATVYTTMESPLGRLLLSGVPDGTGGVALRSVTAPGQKGAPEGPADGWVADDAAFAEVVAQLDAYFAGERTDFSLTLDPEGSDFRRAIWAALAEIPYGETVTYGELGAMAGQPPAAVRAVGGAVGANPLLVILPCHRVLGANGAMTGFAAGVDRKRQLLALERPALF